MTETRDQRIERWMSAMNAVIPSRAEPHLSRETRRALAEAIDASNAAAGMVTVSRNTALALYRCWWSAGLPLEDGNDVTAMEGFRKEIYHKESGQ